MTTVQTMDPVPTNTPAAPAEQQPPATTEQSAQTTEQEQQQGQTEGEKPEGAEQQPADKTEQPKKGGVQKRIDELTRKAHEAEREAAFWREQAAKSQAPSTDAAKPARDDFATDADYFEALADWKAEQKVSEFRKQQQAEALNKAEQNQTATRFELYQERVAASLEAIPDYAEVVGASDVPAAPHVLESILDSDSGPQLAYHLAKNPELAEQLNVMTPVQAAREIGRLEARLAQPKAETTPPKRTTNAPAPITPVRGSNGKFTKSPDQMTDAEWYASQRK